jgi:hypothetical protein
MTRDEARRIAVEHRQAAGFVAETATGFATEHRGIGRYGLRQAAIHWPLKYKRNVALLYVKGLAGITKTELRMRCSTG